jgi:general secretion pathway protein D
MRLIRKSFGLLLVGLLSGHGLPMLAAPSAASVRAVRVAAEGGAMVAVIELDGHASFKHSILANPPRVIVDVGGATQTMRPLMNPGEQIVIPVAEGGITRARVGQMGGGVRVVFDLVEPQRYKVERRGGNLVVRFATPPAARPAGAVATTPAASVAPGPTPVAPPAPDLSSRAVSVRAGKKNFEAGMKYEAREEWELAAQHFTVAVAAEPSNAEYKLHLLRAAQQASLALTRRGDALAEQQNYTGAAKSYRAAYAYDRGNDLARVKSERLREQAESAGADRAADFDPRTGNVVAASAPIRAPERPRSSDVMQVIVFRDAHLRQVIEHFAEGLGLNVLFDESFRDDKLFRIKLQNVTLARALDLVLLQTKHQFEQVDRRTLLIYSDNPVNRQRFEQLLVKTFYLGNANLEEVKAMVQQMIGQQRQVAVIKQLNALVVRDTAGNLQMVQQLIDGVDKNRAEVVVDVNIYEVSRSTSLELGNQLAASAMPVTETRFDSGGRPVSVTVGNSASLSNLGGVGRAGIGAIAGNTLAPVLGGVGALIGLPPSSLSLLQSKGHSRLLASTQVHALDGEQNQTKVGRSVPIRLGTSFVPGVVGAGQGAGGVIGGFGGTFDSIQYKDVGLIIDVAPTISTEGFVQIKLRLESTNVEAAGEDINLTPSFTQRSLSTVARVPGGQTAVVAGIKQESKGDTRIGVPVLSMIPLLGRFISTPRQSSSLSDIVITVTPHILRAPELKKEDHLARYGGTTTNGVAQSIEDLLLQSPTQNNSEPPVIARQPLTPPLTLPASPAPPAVQTASGHVQDAAPAAPQISATAFRHEPSRGAAEAQAAPGVATQPPAAVVSQQVDISLLPAKVEAQAGESFFVVVSLNGPVKMNDAQVTLKYDPARLRFLGVHSGGLLGSRPHITHQESGGELTFRLQQAEDRESPVAAQGQLLLVEFATLSGGVTKIDFDLSRTALRLGGSLNVVFVPENAEVIIARPDGPAREE